MSLILPIKWLLKGQLWATCKEKISLPLLITSLLTNSIRNSLDAVT